MSARHGLAAGIGMALKERFGDPVVTSASEASDCVVAYLGRDKTSQLLARFQIELMAGEGGHG